jgi:hypothetical protein
MLRFHEVIAKLESDDRLLHVCIRPKDLPVITLTKSRATFAALLKAFRVDSKEQFIEHMHYFLGNAFDPDLIPVFADFAAGLRQAISNLVENVDNTFSVYENDGDDGWVIVSADSIHHACSINFLSPDQIATEFYDNTQATQTFEELQMMFEDPRFEQWLEVKDSNYGTRMAAKFAKVRTLYEEIHNELFELE